MKNIAENNLVRFINITKKKDGIFANFRAKGVRGGIIFSSAIAVDIVSAEVDPADPLEKIIEECARVAVREVKKLDLQFEGVPAAV